MSFDPMRDKFREAKSNLLRLDQIETSKEFYPAANAFLVAARSVLYVARHHFGWDERRSADRLGFNVSQVADRKSFDRWFCSSPEACAVLNHPLSEERRKVVHRAGYAGFVHIPKPDAGLAIAEGTAHSAAVVSRGRRVTLPLEDSNVFYFRDQNGVQHDASRYCRLYLELVEVFFHAVERAPWR